MSVEHWQKDNDRNNQSTETKTCFNATLYHINHTWIGMNMGQSHAVEVNTQRLVGLL